MCPCDGMWHGSPGECVYYLARQVQALKQELRGVQRTPDAFTATFTVVVDVPDPHDTPVFGMPRTPEQLEAWLRALVSNSQPRGVQVEVSRPSGDDRSAA